MSGHMHTPAMVTLLYEPRVVSEGHYLLTLCGCSAPSAPGQFHTIRVGDSYDPLLRRPFSIFWQEGDRVELLVQVVGRGTALLAARKPGPVDTLGPLGKPFSVPEGKELLLVGGGVGNAPLHYLARRLREAGNRVTGLFGFRSARHAFMIEKFTGAVDRCVLVTDDGSAGEKGFVTDHLGTTVDPAGFDRVYTCGPTPMMERVTSLVPEPVPVEVSLETYFGCGFGICSGCTLVTADGLKRACVDGPVLDGRIIDWEELSYADRHRETR